MNSKNIEDWVKTVDELCEGRFAPKMFNVNVMFMGGQWRVLIESPKISVQSADVGDALAEARFKLDEAINRGRQLAKTLGLEVA